MNRKTSSLLRKSIFLLGAVTLGWAAKAQTTNPSDSTGMHRQGMNHHWGHRNDSDSSMAKNHRGPGGFASHRGGQMGHGRFGRGHEFIHYTPEQRKQVAAINKDYRQKS